MKEYALGFMFDDRQHHKVLLIEKSSPEWQAGKLNGVGGKIEPNETAVEAMVREFFEETGIDTTVDDWTQRIALYGANETVHIFTAEGNTLLARQTTQKDKPIRCDYTTLPTNVIPNLRWIIPFLLDKEGAKADVFYPSFLNEARHSYKT